MTTLLKLSEYIERYLHHAEIEDYPNAFNGLQLQSQNPAEKKIRSIACAVDASEFVLDAALEKQADLLIVHHGFLWGGAQKITGPFYRKLAKAIAADLAIYSSHLPLDMHPEVGNNAVLATQLGMSPRQPLTDKKDHPLGLVADMHIPRSELKKRIETATKHPAHLAPGGEEICHRVALITGGAGREVHNIARQGIDTFITGEGTHDTYSTAEELGVNLFYAGHYATETFGVKALCKHLDEKFQIPWSFIDHPSGL